MISELMTLELNGFLTLLGRVSRRVGYKFDIKPFCQHPTEGAYRRRLPKEGDSSIAASWASEISQESPSSPNRSLATNNFVWQSEELHQLHHDHPSFERKRGLVGCSGPFGSFVLISQA